MYVLVQRVLALSLGWVQSLSLVTVDSMSPDAGGRDEDSGQDYFRGGI